MRFRALFVAQTCAGCWTNAGVDHQVAAAPRPTAPAKGRKPCRELLEVFQCVVDKSTEMDARAMAALALHTWHIRYLKTKSMARISKTCSAELRRRKKASALARRDRGKVAKRKKLLAACLKRPIKTRPITFKTRIKPCNEPLTVMAGVEATVVLRKRTFGAS